jgi:hypothetical protein
MARRGGAFPPEASKNLHSVFVCQVGDSTLQIISITGTDELRKALLLSYSEPALCLVSVGLSVDDYSPRVQTACRRMHADGGPCPNLRVRSILTDMAWTWTRLALETEQSNPKGERLPPALVQPSPPMPRSPG